MNNEQTKIFTEIIKDYNSLITGSAGTGKTYLLKNIINWARDNDIKFAITASTGCSAYLIKGRTIHSYLGIGLAKKTALELYNDVNNKKHFIIKKLRALKLLILDEISMIDSELFTKISEFLKLVRKSSLPFGGIQIILSGDFCQLPPPKGEYCFKSTEWTNSKIKVHILKELVRQDKDDIFKSILEELRWGLCTKDTLMILKKCKNTEFKNGIIPTILYSKNIDVDNINNKELQKLIDNGESIMKYKTNYFNDSIKYWGESIKIPESITLCVGVQVVLTWNIAQDDGLINGSRGVVTEITPLGPKIKFISGKEVLIEPIKIYQEECEQDTMMPYISFIPVRLAYALSVHRSQGMTLDAVIIDIGESIFEYGQAYTALSRVKSLDSVRILHVRTKSFKTHEDVISFYKK